MTVPLWLSNNFLKLSFESNLMPKKDGNGSNGTAFPIPIFFFIVKSVPICAENRVESFVAVHDKTTFFAKIFDSKDA